VRLGSKADICSAIVRVRFGPKGAAAAVDPAALRSVEVDLQPDTPWAAIPSPHTAAMLVLLLFFFVFFVFLLFLFLLFLFLFLFLLSLFSFFLFFFFLFVFFLFLLFLFFFLFFCLFFFLPLLFVRWMAQLGVELERQPADHQPIREHDDHDCYGASRDD